MTLILSILPVPDPTVTVMKNTPAASRTTRSISYVGPSVILGVPTVSAIMPVTSANEDGNEQYFVVPPDGGWGWVVVIVAFVCNFIIDGTTYTFGIFLQDISQSFAVHPTRVALVSSLLSGFYYFAGPLSCGLCNKVGFRFVGIVGGIFSASTFLISSFLNDFLAFLLVIGVVSGIAFNMVYTPCMLVVGFYFERWRALATSISVTGTGIGIMTFPLMMEQLLKSYNWRTKFQILSGICLLLSVLVIAFRPLKVSKITGVDKKVTFHEPSNDYDSIGDFNMEDEVEESGRFNFSFKKLFNEFHNRFFPTLEDATRASFDQSRRTTGETFYAILPGEGNSEDSIARSCFRTSVSIGPSTGYSMIFEEEKAVTRKCCECRCPQLFPDRNFNRPLYRDDILYPSSVYTLPQYVNSKSANRSRPLSYHLSVSRVLTQKDIEESKGCQCCPEAFIRILVTMLDYRLFKHLSFALLTASGFLTMIGLYVPFVFAVERGRELGFDANRAALLLSVMGGANVAGRIACGIISVFPSVDCLIVSWTTLMVAGIATAASGFLDQFAAQAALFSVFGVCVASFTTLRTVVITNMLGLNNLTNAFGITILFYGMASFVGIPLSGYIQNVTGSYGNCFVFAGCALFLSGVILIPIKKVGEWEANKEARRVGRFRQ